MACSRYPNYYELMSGAFYHRFPVGQRSVAETVEMELLDRFPAIFSLEAAVGSEVNSKWLMKTRKIFYTLTGSYWLIWHA